MPEITIKTNGSVEGTTLMLDGKEISKEDKIVSIEMMASAPFKSQYSGDTIPGRVMVYYDKANDDGTIERRALVSGNDASTTGLGQTIKNSDQVIRYIDHSADAKIVDLVDCIIDHCEETKTKCPDRETLLSRSITSLEDKARDLEIDILDAKKEYYAVKADETEGSKPKYPINNCADVEDAWRLRGHAKGLKISQDTLEKRIKRRARALGCDIPGESNNDEVITDEKKIKTENPGEFYISGTTSIVDGHAHSYSIDKNGTGATSTILGHQHTITKRNVTSADGHTHKLAGGVGEQDSVDMVVKDATGSTSESEGHEHSYAVDRNGNGSTNTVDGHMHDIKKWKVQTTNGHKHSVQVPNKPRRGATREENPNK